LFLCKKASSQDTKTNWVESKGWKITSYGDVNELLYGGRKMPVFNRNKELLGYYRTDFLDRIKINGVGIGDGEANDSSKYLHYDYFFNDGTCYLSDYPLGAYDNKIFPWTSERPSVAVNPPIPRGTRLVFQDLGQRAYLHSPTALELLSKNSFHADDKFFLPQEQQHEKKIDVYVGTLERTDFLGYQSLLLTDATVMIERAINTTDNFSIKHLADNWLVSDQKQFNPSDINYDNKVDLVDLAYIANHWEPYRSPRFSRL